MKRSHVFATIAAFALAVCTAAAQSASTQDPYGQSSKSQNPHNGMVTVTGCLSSGSGASSTSTTGTSGSTTASNAANGKWILNNASFTSGSATGTSGSMTSSTTASSASNAASSSSSYTLVGHEKDLQKYANAKVEVRGTIEGTSSSAKSNSGYGSSTAGSSTTGTTASQDMNAKAETLRVSSVRKIADSCQ